MRTVKFIDGGIVLKRKRSRLAAHVWVAAAAVLLCTGTYLADYLTGGDILLFNYIAASASLAGIALITVRMPGIVWLPVLGFACFTQYFGMMLNFYDRYRWYDLAMHGSSGVLLVLVGFYVYQLLTRRQGNGYPAYALPVVFSTLFSVAGAAVWEIYEFSVDSLLGLHTQLGSLYDTMTDIVAGSAGAAVGALVLFGILIGKRRLPR